MQDKQIEKLIKEEEKRQKQVINLIASENEVSCDVLKALGSKLTNKYAEGYPGRRYYGGNNIIDKIENLAIKRALRLFKLKENDWHVNVQALSGSPANFALYCALVPLGGKIMGMKLSSGGHLTHGYKLSMTGKIWKSIQYEVNPVTEVIDYEEFRQIADSCGALLHVDMSHFAGLVAGGVYPSPFLYADSVMTTTHKSLRGPRHAILFVKKDERGFDKKIDKAIIPGLYGGPHENTIAAVAVSLWEDSNPEFKRYAKQVVKNAKVLAGELKSLGWRVVSGGTDTHLILLDTWMGGIGLSGKEASERLEKEGIIVNMNTIPGEARNPMDPSGIRLGTYTETSRGKKEKDMINLAKKIDKILRK